MEKNVKKELRNARKDLFKIQSKSVIAKTSKTALTAVYLVGPMALVAIVGGYVLNLGMRASRGYYYEEKVLDNNGNEISNELTTNAHSNTVKVYNSCTKSDEGYLKTYDTYYNDKINEEFFLNSDKGELVEKLGTPSDTGYEIDSKYLDLDKEYAYYTIYSKTDRQYIDPTEKESYFLGYSLVGGAIMLTGAAFFSDALAKGMFDKEKSVASDEIKNTKEKIKILKRKEEK